MDYFAEIASSPDVVDALQTVNLKNSNTSIPLILQNEAFRDTYPSLWRTELINWFYRCPWRAAEVWKELQYTESARNKLAKSAAALIDEFERSVLLGGFASIQPAQVSEQAVRQAELNAPYTPFGRARWIQALVQFHQPDQAPPKSIDAAFVAEMMKKNRAFIDELRKATGATPEAPMFIAHLLRDMPWTDPVRPDEARRFPDPMDEVADLIRDRDRLIRVADKQQAPVPFPFVHERELEQIEQRRQATNSTPATIVLAQNGLPQASAGGSPKIEADPPASANANGVEHGESSSSPDAAPIRKALRANIVGLAFSGGGIRSATFNLGVLQALASLNMLRHCDYLSTVSGGGYIGTWFSAWVKREYERKVQTFASPSSAGAHTAEDVMEEMRTRLSPSQMPDPMDRRVRPIRYLREFSNYLTPKKGVFSADTWTMIAIYLRNALLNLMILIPLVSAVLLLARSGYQLTRLLYSAERSPFLVPLLIAGLLGCAGVVLVANLHRISLPSDISHPTPSSVALVIEEKSRVPWYARQASIQGFVVFPLTVASWLTATSFWLWVTKESPLVHWRDRWSIETLYAMFPSQPLTFAIIALAIAMTLAVFPFVRKPSLVMKQGRRFLLLMRGVLAAGVFAFLFSGYLNRFSGHPVWWVLVGLVPVLVALFLLVRSFGRVQQYVSDDLALVTVTVAALLATLAWGISGLMVRGAITSGVAQKVIHLVPADATKNGALACAAGIGILLLSFSFSNRFFHYWRNRPRAVFALVIAESGSTAAAFGLFFAIGKLMHAFSGASGLWLATIFGPPLILAALTVTIAIQLGLLGSRFPDEQREWWSRLRAWMLIYSVVWTCAFAGAILPPVWAHHLTETQAEWGGPGALVLWLLSTIAGIRTAPRAVGAEKKARETQSPLPKLSTGWLSPGVLKFVATVAPYVFIIGLIIGLSLVIEQALKGYLGLAGLEPWDRSRVYPNGWLALVAIALGFISFVVSWRTGVNEFSMHNFYKNRLVRCYLGASRWQDRRPDFFTGFDSEDDVSLSRFDWAQAGGAHPGPYPIINAALNLVGGEDLAWQERKATSFVFTPKYCGYDPDRAVLTPHDGTTWPDGYAPTKAYACDRRGLTAGMATATSGAAANPNMGRVTSPASAFLMTVFNVRLGWWLPNPRQKKEWTRSNPVFGITYPLFELFGLTDDKTAFVNLSDGGHFENLGIYELVRRGCRFIIASDIGQDGAFALEDLGNAIRKCRTDFGVDIDINVDQIRDRDARGWSKSHCVVGKIHYLGIPRRNANGEIDYDAATRKAPGHEEGVLVYLKPSITGDEPYDVLEYYKRVPEFPHESTADQWFNESQFESYRRLGLHIADAAFRRFKDVQNPTDLFANLLKYWYPPNPTIDQQGSSHNSEYLRILELVRSSKLADLDPVLFSLIARPGARPANRDEFYVCNSLIQLMENVYFDFDLEQNYEHPHIEGWMQIFRSWAASPEFKQAWIITKSTYAQRFQQFYDERLL